MRAGRMAPTVHRCGSLDLWGVRFPGKPFLSVIQILRRDRNAVANGVEHPVLFPDVYKHSLRGHSQNCLLGPVVSWWDKIMNILLNIL